MVGGLVQSHRHLAAEALLNGDIMRIVPAHWSGVYG
jgi:hypothetical protein